jgi:hypothetical protein
MFVGMKFGFVTALLVSLFSLAGNALSAAYTVYLWTWFVVPLGAPSIRYWHAFGLYAFANYLAYHAPSGSMLVKIGVLDDLDQEATRKQRRMYLAYAFTVSFIVPSVTYAIGYVAHQFM